MKYMRGVNFNVDCKAYIQTHFEEEDQNLEDSIEAVLEVNAVRSVISVPAAGGIETIVNLKEWLKSPYQLISDLS